MTSWRGNSTLGNMPFLKPLPHVLVTLDLDAEISRWVLGHLDRRDLWHVIATKRASSAITSPKRHVKLDDVEHWASGALGVGTVSLRRLVDAPAPTWQIKASSTTSAPPVVPTAAPALPSPTWSPENGSESFARSRDDIYPGWL